MARPDLHKRPVGPETGNSYIGAAIGALGVLVLSSALVPLRDHLPNADTIHRCGFYFGNYPELSSGELETLSSCLRKK